MVPSTHLPLAHESGDVLSYREERVIVGQLKDLSHHILLQQVTIWNAAAARLVSRALVGARINQQ